MVFIKRVDDSQLGHFRVDGVYCRLISLTREQYAIVCESDYDYLSQWLWYAQKGKYGHYAVRVDKNTAGKTIKLRMHRVVLGLKYDDPRIGDHINTQETLNNSRGNLRVASRVESQCNRSMPRHNTSGLKGVRWDWRKRKYRADLWFNRKHFYVGYADTAEAAHEKYKAALTARHGEFANSGRYKSGRAI